MKRGYYRDPRLGGGRFRDMIERQVAAGRATVVWTPERGWVDQSFDDEVGRWHDDGGACVRHG